MSDDEALWPPRQQHVVPNDWQSRALAYEQALQKIATGNLPWFDARDLARAALDKPMEGK